MTTISTRTESGRPETSKPASRKSKANGLLRTSLDNGKDTVLDALDGRTHAVKRAARKARFATEDAFGSAAVQLRRHPLRSAGVAFAAGAALAVIAGQMRSLIGPR